MPDLVHTKQCISCLDIKTVDDFTARTRQPDGLNIYCKVCWRQRYVPTSEERHAYHIRWAEANPEKWVAMKRKRKLAVFGLTPEAYAELLEAQGGVCAICGLPERYYRSGKLLNLAVDHDHNTGDVRGLLCANCNRGIGMFSDDAETLRRAAEYLGRDET